MKKEYIIIGLLFLILGVFIYLKSKKNNDNLETPIEEEKISNQFPLKYGSRGDDVKRLQQWIIRNHGIPLLKVHGADGVYGKETEQAILKIFKTKELSKELFDKNNISTIKV